MFLQEVRFISVYRRYGMSEEMLKSLIELVPEEDLETIYKVIIKFIPEEKPFPEEIEAIEKANKSIAEYGTISHEEINWE